MADFRIEKDTMGEVKVPADKIWGAQTERSRNNFKIGPSASMPLEVIYGFAYLKKAAAYANHELGVLPVEKRDLIARVCDEILEGKRISASSAQRRAGRKRESAGHERAYARG